MKFNKSILLSILLGASGTAMAASEGVSVRAEAGITGFGGALTYNVNPYLGLTFGYNGGDLGWLDTVEISGTDYDVEMDYNNAYVNAEIRPFANWFYVAAGVALVDQEYAVDKYIAAGERIKIGGKYYTLDPNATSSGHVGGKVEYKGDFVPYVGLGFTPQITSRLGIFGEVGAYYSGSASAELFADNLTAQGHTVNIDDSLEKEARKIEGYKIFEWIPVAKVGLTFKF